MNKIIAYIDTMYHGGAQRVMANLTEYFASLGITVVLVNDFIQDESKPQYTISESIKRMYLRNSLKGNPLFKNVKRIFALRKIIKDEKPDLVFSFLGNPNKRMLLASYRLSCKKIVSVRNDPNREYGASFFAKRIANRLFRLADGCVFQTREASMYFSESIRNKSQIIWNPVSEEFYESHALTGRKNMVSVGRLVPQKNFTLLITAFAKIAEEFPDENLSIYGEGAMKDRLQKSIDELNLTKRIKLCGNENNIKSVLEKAKVFVMSSDYEGMPNALMEAMASGLACVSTNCPCGGPNELIDNGKDGILTECGNVNELASAMRRLLQDGEERERLGNTAREKAQSFRSNRIYEQWRRYFDACIEADKSLLGMRNKG